MSLVFARLTLALCDKLCIKYFLSGLKIPLIFISFLSLALIFVLVLVPSTMKISPVRGLTVDSYLLPT